jgi:signal transduction histidine kinase
VVALTVDDRLGGRLADGSSTFFVLVVLAYSIGRYTERRRLVAGSLVLMVGVLVDALVAGTPDGVVNDLAFDLIVVCALPLVAGVVLRRRALLIAELRRQRRTLEQQREARVRDAAEAERVRIAGELHDVVVHDVSAMVVQAATARALLRSRPAEAADAIGHVERAGREALDELRRALGVLRTADRGLALEPQPTLRRLPALADSLRAGGATVVLDVDPGLDALPGDLQLAAYRIAQEVVATAGEDLQRAAIRVVREDGTLGVDVHHDGAPPTTAALAAARTRVSLFGGDLDVVDDEHGKGGRVCARLPLPIAAG